MDLRSMRGWHHRYHPATTQGYHFCVGQCDNGCEKGYTADAKSYDARKEFDGRKGKYSRKAITEESRTYEKKKTFAKINAPKREAKPKAEFGDDMPDTEEKGPVLFPMSTLPEEHLFKMQTAEAQATTSNAVQSEDDRQQIRRITVKL